MGVKSYLLTDLTTSFCTCSLDVPVPRSLSLFSVSSLSLSATPSSIIIAGNQHHRLRIVGSEAYFLYFFIFLFLVLILVHRVFISCFLVARVSVYVSVCAVLPFFPLRPSLSLSPLPPQPHRLPQYNTTTNDTCLNTPESTNSLSTPLPKSVQCLLLQQSVHTGNTSGATIPIKPLVLLAITTALALAVFLLPRFCRSCWFHHGPNNSPPLQHCSQHAVISCL